MAKEITFDTNARDRIKRGVDKLADAVKVTDPSPHLASEETAGA